MRAIAAKAALVLADSRQFDAAEIAALLGERESEIVSTVTALRTIREEVLEAEALETLMGIRP